MNRLEKLADEAVGPVGCNVTDTRQRPGFCPFVWATSLGEVNEYVHYEDFPDLNRFYGERFLAQNVERRELTGDADAFLESPIAIECDAFEALINVVPTSIEGVTAWMNYLHTTAVDEVGERRLPAEYVPALNGLGKV